MRNRKLRWTCVWAHTQSGRALLAVCGIVVVALCMGGGCDNSGEQDARRQFDSALWKSGDVEIRGLMAHDLVTEERNRLLGKTASGILKLLGAPDSRIDGSWGYDVDIGQDFLGTPWMYHVNLTFDDEGKVSEVYLLD